MEHKKAEDMGERLLLTRAAPVANDKAIAEADNAPGVARHVLVLGQHNNRPAGGVEAEPFALTVGSSEPLYSVYCELICA